MAGNATVVLQVGEFSLAGIDTTQRKTVIEGAMLPLESALATLTVVAGGTNWAVGDLFQIAGGNGGIGKVATLTGSAVATATVANGGLNYAAVTGAATTAITPSAGAGLTVTTTVNTNGGQLIAITGWSITSNVVTFTAVNTLTTGGGQVITVQGFTGAYTYLNATFTTNSATATTILAPLTHANASGSQQGVAYVQGTYQTAGIPISYAFVDQLGRQNPIGTLGPLSVPTWITFQTIQGSAYNYKINTTVTPNLLLIFSGITQVSDATAITLDAAAFRAEFVKNSF